MSYKEGNDRIMKKENAMTHITLVIWVIVIIIIGYLGINFILKETRKRESGKPKNGYVISSRKNKSNRTRK